MDEILQVSKEYGSTASIAVMRKVRSFVDYCKVFSVKFNQLHQTKMQMFSKLKTGGIKMLMNESLNFRY